MQMASMVTDVIQSDVNGIIEAGTGTGKTFAYLLPAMAAGKKTIISTGTKNLQDQLFYKDIPLVNKEFRLRTAILKGRGNYLCPRRLRKNLATLPKQGSLGTMSDLVKVDDWSRQTKTGDLTELLDLGEGSSVVPLVSSTVDNCLGRHCDCFDECPLYRARAIANEADLIVVNHHLLFADLALKEESLSQLLPEAELIIVDEAHQIPDVARLFFGERLSTGQFIELVRDIRKEQLFLGTDDPQLSEQASLLHVKITELVEICNQPGIPLDQLLLQVEVKHCVEDVDLALASLINHLRHRAERTIGLRSCYTRAIRLADLFTLLTEATDREDEYVHWIDRQERSKGRSGFTIFLAPLNVSRELKPLFNQANRSWLFVSATLTIAGSFTHIKSALGLNDTGDIVGSAPNDFMKNLVEAKFESPFDFGNQVRGYVPPELPTPGGDFHTRKLVEAVLPVIRATRGRCFFLFTSHRALRLATSLLQQEHDIVFLTQGAMPKKMLLEKFRTLSGCVLLATQSFWEGVDVRGADLRCLIIDKLPFASPDNPLIQAQLRYIESTGRNGFTEYSLPEAAISLKQGFGRLIREESDRGLFILGDARIRTRSYGRILLESLPSFSWLQHQNEALDYMIEIDRHEIK